MFQNCRIYFKFTKSSICWCDWTFRPMAILQGNKKVMKTKHVLPHKVHLTRRGNICKFEWLRQRERAEWGGAEAWLRSREPRTEGRGSRCAWSSRTSRRSSKSWKTRCTGSPDPRAVTGNNQDNIFNAIQMLKECLKKY